MREFLISRTGWNDFLNILESRVMKHEKRLGVLITVFGVMVAIFYAFAGRRKVDS